jgi:hypothetical protein
MGAKVTFDPVNKFIIVGSGIVELDVRVDMYSDAKEDWLTNSTLQKFEFPFRPIGGDFITQDKIVTPRYFVASGWRIKPDERTHELLIVGDLFSDVVPPQPLAIATSGAFTVDIIFNRTFDALTNIVQTPVVIPSAVSFEGLIASFI